MGTSKIKKINKKWRHEQRRKKHRQSLKLERQANSTRNRRMRKLFAEGKREHQLKRRAERAYIDDLQGEILSE